jgi:hypothetical protein
MLVRSILLAQGFVLFVKKREVPPDISARLLGKILASQREVMACGGIYDFQCDLGTKRQFPVANSIAHEIQISTNIKIMNENPS